MGYEQSPMSKILETIADRLVDMHLSNNRRFDELAAQLEALLPTKVGEQLSLLAIVTASEPTVVPNEDEAMPVVEPTIVQDEPSPRKRNPCLTTFVCLAKSFVTFTSRSMSKPRSVSWCLQPARAVKPRRALPCWLRSRTSAPRLARYKNNTTKTGARLATLARPTATTNPTPTPARERDTHEHAD